MTRVAAIIGIVSLLWGSALAQDTAPDGAQLFETHCAACHNSGGTGTPGLAPPLDRPDFWQTLGEDAPAYIAAIVTKGINMPITVRGERYAGMPMAPVAGASDEELAEITSWVLSDLGKLEQTVAAEDIPAARDGGISADDLKALRPETE